jgi:hypothetical protein
MPERPTIDLDNPTWANVGNPLGAGLQIALEQSASAQEPFLVRPSLPDARMTAQEGLFIAGSTPSTPWIGGVDSFPVRAVPVPDSGALAALFAPDERRPGRPRQLPFLALVIPPRLKARIITTLGSSFNRRRRFLFPDVAGLAEAFRLDQTAS